MGIRILVGTDGSELSRRTADFVVRLSTVLPLEVDLALAVDLHRVEYKMVAEMYVDMIREGARKTADMTLEREAEYLRSRGVPVKTRIVEGQPGPALCETASSENYALVVLGRKGEGGDIQDILFGSTSNWVVHHCKTPVLIVKGMGLLATGSDAKRPVRILAGVDGSACARRAVELLRTIGTPEGTDLTLLHVVNPEKADLKHLPGDDRYQVLQDMHRKAQALLDDAAKPLIGAGFRVTTRVEEGVAARIICRIYHEDAFEISVMGHRGLSELRDVLFGSVSNHVLHHCPGHILMVP